jgi:glycosyltransferase involved in cell wall biosynthesis
MLKQKQLRICCIGWGHSIHTQRFVGWFVKRGHEVHLITDYPVPMEKVTVHDISWKTDTRPRYIRYWQLGFNIKFIRLLKTIFRVRKLVNDINPDILHLHTLFYPSYLGIYANFHPLVIMPWNGDILWKLPYKTKFHNIFLKYALRTADSILVNSAQMQNACLKVVKDTAKLQKRTGVDLKTFYFRNEDGDIRKRLNLENSPVLISTRSLADIYNIDIIIKSIPLVLRKIPDAKFIFTWYFYNNDTYSKIKQLVDNLNIKDAIRFLGKIENYEMPKYFNIADVFISISSKDSAPMSLFEAMACGVPPVTADHPAVNELVKDGWNGYIVPQRDPEATAQAIIKLLEDEKIRKLFAERNLKWVRENADLDKNMGKIEKLYYSLVKEARK